MRFLRLPSAAAAQLRATEHGKKHLTGNPTWRRGSKSKVITATPAGGAFAFTVRPESACNGSLK